MKVYCRQVFKQFKTKKGVVTALRDVTFQTEEREFLCLLGPSGCGKTTLLRIIAGLLEPTGGKVKFDGAGEGLATVLVFQEHGIFPWMNVIDNACFALEMRGVPRSDRRRQAMPLLERLGLARFLHSYPYQLSLGMKQRVGLARALVSGPGILLMDEPFAALDAQMRLISQQLLLDIHKEYDKPVIYVTHDIDEALLLADRILLMTARPGTVKSEIRLERGRQWDRNGNGAEEMSRYKVDIWRQLREEVETDGESTPA